MPRKQRTFADKVKAETHVIYCPKCGGAQQSILYVQSIKTSSGSVKFRGKNVNVCKCNQAEIYK
ncbi:MAG: hypothetical protein OEV55_01175 [candidate division Zixibacteria bacterium]|nr:hypothetical protein [candidate division Zixibacteria bacterium]